MIDVSPVVRGRGRPKVADPRNVIYVVHFNEEEAMKVNQAVKRAGKQRSAWMREKLLEAAKG